MNKRFIISGGGTGGHIFPAIAIANQIKNEVPDADILFIGANGKMEMKRVPEAGYPIVGLDVYGISRDFSLSGILRNIKLPFVLLKTSRKVKKVIRNFKPDVAIGVGGFASGPAINAAISLHVPALIQEQNSYPGITNKILSKKVNRICVAYNGLEKYFPKEKIVLTGNPVRSEILNMKKKNPDSYRAFGLNPAKKTILVVGGSLGAFSINKCIADGLDKIEELGVQLLWQTGDNYFKTISPQLLSHQSDSVKIVPFIKNMNDAYSVADIIVSRAGALAIAELAIVASPTILVPFPYAAEDHQTKNAAALVKQNAAYLVPDNEAAEKLLPQIISLINNDSECNRLSSNIASFAQPDAIHLIIDEILKL